jgi:hypothetical protein
VALFLEKDHCVSTIAMRFRRNFRSLAKQAGFEDQLAWEALRFGGSMCAMQAGLPKKELRHLGHFEGSHADYNDASYRKLVNAVRDYLQSLNTASYKAVKE